MEEICFDIEKIPKDSRDRSRTGRLDAVLGEHCSLTVTASIRNVVVPLHLRDARKLPLMGFQVQWKNMRPQFVLQSLTLRASIALDIQLIGMLYVIR
jgi:hypothetical protein